MPVRPYAGLSRTIRLKRCASRLDAVPQADNTSHDLQVGELLKVLDDLGIADNTIVQYSTDNGPHYNSWPDAGTTPFRSEKNSNWEGAYRVPCFIRWPGHFPKGMSEINAPLSH